MTDSKEKKPKPIPRLRRPDELFRTLFTRLSIRRQPFMYLGFDESPNEFCMSTTLEDDMLYGNPLYAQSLLRITNPELLVQMQDLLSRIGYTDPSVTVAPYYLDIRDLGSFLNKFKEPNDYPVEKDDETDQWWQMVTKKKKKEEGGGTTLVRKYFREPTITQFRFDTLTTWYNQSSAILDDKGTFWRVPFQDGTDRKQILQKWTSEEVSASPIGDRHPAGLKMVLSRGYDFLDTKFLTRSKYDIDRADLVFWIESGSAVRIAHHVKTVDFEIVTTRPYCVLL